MPFVSVLYSFICASTTEFTWLSKFCTLQLSSTFYLYLDPSWCRVSVLKGTNNFFKLFKKTICKGVCTKKRFILFPPPFPPLNCPPYRFKGSPAHARPNVIYKTSFKNDPSFSTLFPSILNLLYMWQVYLYNWLNEKNGDGLTGIYCLCVSFISF